MTNAASSSLFRLENSWRPVEGDPTGALDFRLFNLSDAPISGFSLAYTSLTRVSGASRFENADFIERNANYHAFKAPEGLVLQPGENWSFSVVGLTRPAKHRTDGAKSAFLILDDDRYFFDPERLFLSGKRQGRLIRMGQRLKLKLLRVDVIQRKLDFGFEDWLN